jgi:ribonucleoside-triphosphate reductase
MMERTKCEVYSRIVGYLRPVQQWNFGKKEEFKERKVFNEESSLKSKRINKPIQEKLK